MESGSLLPLLPSPALPLLPVAPRIKFKTPGANGSVTLCRPDLTHRRVLPAVPGSAPFHVAALTSLTPAVGTLLPGCSMGR